MSKKNQNQNETVEAVEAVEAVETMPTVIDRRELTDATFTDANALYSAIVARSGESRIEIKKDSSGDEFATATFDLQIAKGKVTEITVRNMEIATRIERIERAMATADVAYFIKAKEMSYFTDTDAVEIGFDSAVQFFQHKWGLGKSTIQNYIRIAKYFVKDDYKLVDAIPADTPIGILNELLSLVKKENSDGSYDISNVEKLFTSGIISSTMKEAEVKARLKTLRDMETDKELSELSVDEIKEVKDYITEDSKNRKAKKAEKKTEKKNSEVSPVGVSDNENKVTVSTDPVIIGGEALKKLKELKELLIKLHIDADLAQIEEAVNAVIDETL